MQDLIYLFKDGSQSCFTFNHLYDLMKIKGHQCIKLIDEDSSNAKLVIDSLKNEKVILITTDHFNVSYKDLSGNNSYSVNEIIKILNPIKKIYSFHDLGIHRVDDNLNDWNVLIPSELWKDMVFKYKISDCDFVGWPKYYNNNFHKKYDTVFFVSLVYIYKDRSAEHFMDLFGDIIQNKIPLKFPNYSGSLELIEKLKKDDIFFDMIPMSENSFDILCSSKNSITNSNSSIAIESSIAGCNSINIGVTYEPKEIYDNFNIKIVSTSKNALDYLMSEPQLPMIEYQFNLNKAYNFIVKNL